MNIFNVFSAVTTAGANLLVNVIEGTNEYAGAYKSSGTIVKSYMHELEEEANIDVEDMKLKRLAKVEERKKAEAKAKREAAKAARAAEKAKAEKAA